MAKKKKSAARRPARAAKSARVTPVPEGFHTLTPYLIVSDGAAAISFYEKAFGAKVRDRMAMPDGRLMHASLKIGDGMIMLTEECPEWNARSPKSLGGTPVSVHVYVANADKTFDRAVAAGATVKMPVSEQFWGDRFGKLADPFGHEWSIAARVKKLTPAQVRKAAQVAFTQKGQGSGS